MQVKAVSVAAALTKVCLNIHKGKIKVLKYNKTSTNRTTINGEALEDVETHIPGQQHQ